MASFHSLFDFSDGDIVFSSSDSVLFHVHSIILKLASGFFRQMLEVPRVGSEQANDPIPLAEDAKTLALLLSAIYPHYDSFETVRNFEEAWAVTHAAEKYDMPSAFQTVRLALTENKLSFQDPLRLYALACQWKWKDIIKASAERAIEKDLMDDLHAGGIKGKGVSEKNLLDLLCFRRIRIDYLLRDLEKWTISEAFVFSPGRKQHLRCCCSGTDQVVGSVADALSTLLLALRGAFESRTIDSVLENRDFLWETVGSKLWGLKCKRCGVAAVEMDEIIRRINDTARKAHLEDSWEELSKL